MRPNFAFLLDGLALTLAMGFVALAPLFAFAAGLTGALLDRPLAHRLVDDLGSTERAGGLAVRLWFHQSQGSRGVGVPPHLVNLPPEAWETVAGELLPADWLRAQAHGLVDAGYDWLKSDEALPAGRIDLEEVRERLYSPAGAPALLPLLAQARPCSPPETAEAVAAVSAGVGVFVPCLPPGADLAVLARQTARYTADQMPAAIDLPSAARDGMVAPEAVAQLEQARRWVRWTLALIGLWREVCLILLAGHLLLSTRTWAAVAERLVPPLGAAGVVTMLIALIVFGLAGLDLAPVEAGWPPGAAELLNEAAGYMGRAAALRVAAWGGGLVGLAALGWWAGRLIRLRASRPGAPPPPGQRSPRPT